MAKKILLVDDEFDYLQTAKEALEKEGYSVEAVTNGANALDLVSIDHFDLIMVDIKMPTLSGYDLMMLLRERLNGRVKIIYVSIVPKEKVDLKLADGFVQKPVAQEDLVKAVNKVLAG